VIFNCFDDDGNGVLSKEEFLKAAKRFSDTEKNIQAFSDRVFKAVCDPGWEERKGAVRLAWIHFVFYLFNLFIYFSLSFFLYGIYFYLFIRSFFSCFQSLSF
jgi:hypothetical protein